MYKLQKCESKEMIKNVQEEYAKFQQQEAQNNIF